MKLANLKSEKRMGTLKGLLLWWIIGSSTFLVLLYIGFLESYFRYGVTLRAKADFERIASTYEQQLSQKSDTPLPVGIGLKSYSSLDAIPELVRNLFTDQPIEDGDIQVFSTDDYESPLPSTHPPLDFYCDNDPCELIFFYPYQLNDGSWLYLTQDMVSNDRIMEDLEISEDIVQIISMIILAILSWFALLLSRRVVRPVQKLARWADELTVDKVTAETPDFKYQELNQVANHLSNAFQDISQGLEKEKQFLQHASHELRTPIAVASGNVELLEKLSASSPRSEEENEALHRLKYSIEDMKQLTETLLWLNRDQESLPPPEPVNLTQLMEDLVEDNRYLLQYKSVKVEVSGSNEDILLPRVLCRILLTNLIRNAFQYTQAGFVSIQTTQQEVRIFNKDYDAENSPLPPEAKSLSDDHGFGLGLKLVEQIARRANWLFGLTPHRDGHLSWVSFKDK